MCDHRRPSKGEFIAWLIIASVTFIAIALAPSPARAAIGCEVNRPSAELITRWEVTSQARYDARYRRPIWPGGASGVTIGIGYDLGHQREPTIMRDWSMHPDRIVLSSAAGVTGDTARRLTPSMQHIIVDWTLAQTVFRTSTLVEYCNRARRAFGPGFVELPPNAQGALVSLVYNRGGAMNGPSRVEMRHIRDVCIPDGDTQCIARQLTVMCRVWAGSELYTGLCNRRRDEARHVDR